MKYIVRIPPTGEIEICPAKFMGGVKKPEVYPTIIDGVAVVGKHAVSTSNAVGLNMTASWIIHRAIMRNIYGVAYLYDSSNGLSDLRTFSRDGAELVINMITQESNKGVSTCVES